MASIEPSKIQFVSIDDLEKKPALTGAERIPVSETEFVTPSQIAEIGAKAINDVLGPNPYVTDIVFANDGETLSAAVTKFNAGDGTTTPQVVDVHVARVGITGSYADLLNVPPVPELPLRTVTEMFSSDPANGWIEARMTTTPAGVRVIEILAKLDPAAGAALEITPVFGFGPADTWPANVREYADINDAAPTDFKVDIEAEVAAVENPDGTVTPPVNGAIIFPQGCPRGRVEYQVGTGTLIGVSYFVDLGGMYGRFNSTNTPLDNLTPYEENDSYILNGVSVAKPSIREIYFGSSYNAATSLPMRFLRGLNSLTALDLTLLSSVESIGDECFNSLNALPYLDMTPLNSVTTMGNGCLSWMNSLTELLVDWSNLTTVGDYFCYMLTALKNLDISTLPATLQLPYPSFAAMPSLESIQLGGVDRSSQDSLVGNFYGLPATGTIYADTQAVADAFIAKVPTVAGWTVVLNY